MYFDRFDIVEAHYWYCVEYHEGQWSPLYERLCRIGRYYKPSPMVMSSADLGINAREIYENLVKGGA